MKVSEARLRQLIANVLREETHTFHGYKFGPDKMGLPGPQFDDESSVTADDVDDGKQWLDDNDPSELVAFSRGSAVLHQMMQDEPGSVPEVPTITYVSPAAMRDWTSAPVPGAPGGSKVVHSMGDNIVPLKQGCQVAAQSGADMYIAPGKADGKDHVRALKYRTGGGTKVDATACADDAELPDWGGTGNASDEELAQQVKRGKELVAEYFLREVIKESHFPLTGGEKVRTHHSRKDTRVGGKPQVSGFSQRIAFKPDGLWYECKDGSAINWLEFCRTGLSGGIGRYDSAYDVILNDYEILFITNNHDFKKFEKMYGVTNSYGDVKIDWPKVASHYDGIEICPYLYRMRADSDWYYGWDVASGCVWNASGIKELISTEEGCRDEPTS